MGRVLPLAWFKGTKDSPPVFLIVPSRWGCRMRVAEWYMITGARMRYRIITRRWLRRTLHHTLGGSLSKWDPGERSGYLTSRDPGAEAEPGWARMPWGRRVLERVEKALLPSVEGTVASHRRNADTCRYSSHLFFFVRAHTYMHGDRNP